MNKRIFTLLISVVLAFSGATTATAETTLKDRLSLGAPAEKLESGNNDFYHLKLDSIATWDATASKFTGKGVKSGTLSDSVVLFLGKNSKLFLHTLDKESVLAVYTSGNDPEFNTTSGKGAVSASALWCTTVDDIPGLGATFRFTNKLQQENTPTNGVLELSVDNYELWGRHGSHATDSVRTHDAELGDGVYNWTFSKTYKTQVEQSRPLYAVLDADDDSVAVLCLNTITPNITLTGWKNNPRSSLVLKIVHINDVEKGNVQGMLYFTLREAAPFALSATDFNNNLGLAKSLAVEGVTLSESSSFLRDRATAVDFDGTIDGIATDRIRLADSAYYVRLKDADTTDISTLAKFRDVVARTGANKLVDTVRYTGAHLDSLGYILFKHTSNNGTYLRVTEEPYNSNDGDKYLKLLYKSDGFITRPGGPIATSSSRDLSELFDYGHYAFRAVYYPSKDHIRINAFQAKHPANSDILRVFGPDAPGATIATLDSIRNLRLTYVADTSALVLDPHVKAGGTPGISADSVYTWAGADKSVASNKDSSYYLTAGLTPGRYNAKFSAEYNYYQRLYVTPVQLLGGLTVETLHDVIDERVDYRFPGYNICREGSGTVSERATLDGGLFLIRNNAGAYLNVPLYSSDDKPVWTVPAAGVDPAYIPSYHWVIEQKYYGTKARTNSSLRITNREFPWVKYSDVQLKKDQSTIGTISDAWNDAKYNLAYTEADWEKNKSYAAYTETFIRLGEESYGETLGYTQLPADKLALSTFQIRYVNGITSTPSFVGTDYDGSPYLKGNINQLEAYFFRFDTIPSDGDNSVGSIGNYQSFGYRFASHVVDKDYLATDRDGNVTGLRQVPGLKELKRQPYYLLSQGSSQSCVTSSTSSYVTLDDEDRYVIGNKGDYPSEKILGKPSYFLRNIGRTTDGEDYFALVQALDVPLDGVTNLTNYLRSKYSATAADRIIDLAGYKRDESERNPGVFIATINSQTGQLEAQLRPDAGQTNAAGFILETNEGRVYRRFDDTLTVSFFSTRGGTSGYYLFENVGQYADQVSYWKDYKKNYLGLINVAVGTEGEKASTALFIDTAYVNRPDGDLKPQYLIAKNPQFFGSAEVCDATGYDTEPVRGYTKARYLINATDSAYDTSTGTPTLRPDGKAYLWNNQWTRLVFVDAIHTDDYLYILNERGKALQWSGGSNSIPQASISDEFRATYPNLYRKDSKGDYFLDIDTLIKFATDLRPDAGLTADQRAAKAAANAKALIDTINLGVNNWHKPVVYSFRIVERGATAGNEDFLIESLGSTKNGADKIAPCKGSWVQIYNGIPVLSEQEATVQELMSGSAIFNVTGTRNSVSNAVISSSPAARVVSEVGGITILGSAGKRVVLSNVLGQPIVSKVLTSDSESISLPKGIVLVSVDGSSVTKAVVK